jgi:2-C-methyl-D-erythritol 4-phosphate cytidylyltransferase
MKRSVLIVAGGRGRRMGGETPKQFLLLGGRPVLMRTLECFHCRDAGTDCVVALPAELHDLWREMCRDFDCRAPHRLAAGGETRFHSVQNALDSVYGNGWVAVHDGVRPFVSSQLIETCFATAERFGAAVPALPVTDSLRRMEEGGGSVPIDRSRYLAVQTPQVFRADWLRGAYRQKYSPAFTDDASAVEACGHPVGIVAGERENIKITTPFDLQIAEALLNSSPPGHD